MRIGPVSGYQMASGSPYPQRTPRRSSGGGSLGRLSQNRLEAMNQIYSEAHSFMPQHVSGTSHNAVTPQGPIQQTALRRYHGALEEWQNYLNFKKDAGQPYNPKDGLQMRAVQDRLSVLTDVLSWMSDRINPSQPVPQESTPLPSQPPLSRLLSQPGFTPPQDGQNPFSQALPQANPFRQT